MKFLNRDRLNLVIAFSAIMISLASFYATYLQAKAADLQAKAANQQLKIMTMPVVRFTHSNYDTEDKTNPNSIGFHLQNAGLGPGVLKSIAYHYNGKSYSNYYDLLMACCNEEVKIMQKRISEAKDNSAYTLSRNGGLWSGERGEFIVPAQDEYTLFAISRGNATSELWEKLNNERWNITVSSCFCSPLGNCYQSSAQKLSIEIDYCPAR
ncbi:hypothetical protein MO867_10655 [Microbulbifer sp. OS29]|uniref:Uncharacterized protein n=1 Tax=Microbulbifer okhotskensis TaxID=2926617 RepID=A0A9X2J6N3_9GAMM|nr:hypothetical protein [Microbulbifer okhotskensis]MCO1334800.1 hypothetical protein [Microbulbifer okhotskensis]